jgi:NADH:ubiquinone oxidoreductase subunit 3 (subunit A)
MLTVIRAIPWLLMVQFCPCFLAQAKFFIGASMQNEWIYIGLFLVIATLIPVAALLASWAVSPKKSNPIKQSTYECGMETVGENWVQFKAQYYIFALVFLVFDVETVFLFPWAVSLGKLSVFAVIEGMVFILILIAGLVYAWRKGMLEWV